MKNKIHGDIIRIIFSKNGKAIDTWEQDEIKELLGEEFLLEEDFEDMNFKRGISYQVDVARFFSDEWYENKFTEAIIKEIKRNKQIGTQNKFHKNIYMLYMSFVFEDGTLNEFKILYEVINVSEIILRRAFKVE